MPDMTQVTSRRNVISIEQATSEGFAAFLASFAV